MKNKFKIILTSLVFGLILVFASCEDDLHEHGNEHNNVTKVNLTDIPGLQNLINLRRATSKGAQDSASYYLERIYTDEIILIETLNGDKSYSFSTQIEKEGMLTNVVIQESNLEYTYYLIEYTPDNWEQWMADVKNGVVYTQGVDMEIKDFSKMANTICWMTSGICPSGLHQLGEQGICEYDIGNWTITATAYDYLGGAGAGGSSSNQPLPSTFTTIPNAGNYIEEEDLLATPCDKIKNATSTQHTNKNLKN